MSYSRLRRRHLGFTLLELIIAVVILAVLATIAIPTFQRDITNATMAKEATTLNSLGTDALSIARSNGEVLPTAADFATAAGEITLTARGSVAPPPYVLTATGSRYTFSTSTQSSPAASSSYGSVSLDTADSITSVGLATQSTTGGCVMVEVTESHVYDWFYSTNLGSNCNGYLALAGPGQVAPGTGTTTTVAPTTTTTAAPTAPSAPTGLSGTAGSDQVSLTWAAPSSNGGSAITGYAVEYSSNGGSTWSSPVATGSTSTSYTVTGLTGITNYVFQVAATNAVGTGTYSAVSASITVATYDQLVASLSPSAWWKLNDAVGSTTVADSSGNGYTGTITGGVTLGQPGAIVGTPSDTAALFDGSTGYITTTFTPPTTVQSISMWVKTTSTNGVLTILDCMGTSTGGFFVLLNGNATSQIQVATNAYTNQVNTPNTNILDGNWHNIVVVLNGSNVSVFLDSVLILSSTLVAMTAAPSPLAIGAMPAPALSRFPGDISQVVDFPTALTATQVSALYNASK